MGRTFDPTTQALRLEVQGVGTWELDPGSLIQRAEGKWSCRSRGREGVQRLDLDLRTGTLNAIVAGRSLRGVPNQVRVNVFLGDQRLGPTVIPLNRDARRKKGSFTYGRKFPLEDHLFLDGWAREGRSIHLWGTFSANGIKNWHPSREVILRTGDRTEEIKPELLIEGPTGFWCYVPSDLGSAVKGLTIDTVIGRFYLLLEGTHLPTKGVIGLVTSEFSGLYEWDPEVHAGLENARLSGWMASLSRIVESPCFDLIMDN